MAVKTGYKTTEAGTIPEQWDAKPLKSVLSRGRLGGNYPNQNAESEFPLMKMGNIARGRFDVSKVEFVVPGVTPEDEHRLAYGDVLFNTRNTLELVGKVAIWRNELPVAYYNSNLMRLELNTNEISSNEYANYALNSTGSIARLRALATGTTSVAAIYTRDLLGMYLAIPPKPEQHAIAKALSDIDALLEALDGVISKKRDLRVAVLQQLLRGDTRLPGYRGAWKQTRLGHIGTCLRGVTYRGDSDLLPSDTPRTHRLLRANNVQGGTIIARDLQFVKSARVSHHQLMQKNDILICMANGSRALVGKAGFFRIEDAFNYTFGAFMGCLRVDPNVADPRFVFHLFSTTKYRNYIHLLLAGSTINNLRPSSIESLEFNFPEIPEQSAIADVLTDMNSELAVLQGRRNKTHDLKLAMMQALLTGKTRITTTGGASE